MEILYQQNTCMYKYTETNPDVSEFWNSYHPSIFFKLKLDKSQRTYLSQNVQHIASAHCITP